MGEKKKAGAKKTYPSCGFRAFKTFIEQEKALPDRLLNRLWTFLNNFQKTFPFKETSGQHQALSEIFKDMEGPYPMERLLSADVGFGKTEVALRTAVRVMANGFQVCFLVPTTILSLQHYENIKKKT